MSDKPRIAPSIPPDAKGIPWAEWEAKQRRNPRRNAVPDLPRPEWTLSTEEKLQFGIAKPKAKRGKAA